MMVENSTATQKPTSEALSLIDFRIDAAQVELQMIRELAHAAEKTSDDTRAICVGIEAIAARAGRILDTCRVMLGDPGAGSFGDLDFMGSAKGKGEVRG